MVFNRPVQLNYDYVLNHYSKGRNLALNDSEQEELVKQVLQNAFTFQYRAKSEQFKAELIDLKILEFRDAQEIDIQIVFDEPLFVSAESEANNRLSYD